MATQQPNPAAIADGLTDAAERLRNAQAEWNHLDKECAAQEAAARNGRVRQFQLKEEIGNLNSMINANRNAQVIITAQQAAETARAQAEAERAETASLKADAAKLKEELQALLDTAKASQTKTEEEPAKG